MSVIYYSKGVISVIYYSRGVETIVQGCGPDQQHENGKVDNNHGGNNLYNVGWRHFSHTLINSSHSEYKDH